MDPMGLREFGAWIGVTGEAVRKAIATGRIPADCVGERRLGSRMVPCITDPQRAADAWGRNTDPTWQRDNAKISAAKTIHGRRAAKHLNRDEPPPARSAMNGGIGAGGISAKVPTITESKAIAEAYKARLLKLEYDEKAGRLISVDRVKIEVSSMIATVRTRLLGVPSKAKQRLPHLSRADVVELEGLIREALEELADYGKQRG